MVEDKDLKRAVDYSEGQKMAAYRVLGEIVNLLNEFQDNVELLEAGCRHCYIQIVAI